MLPRVPLLNTCGKGMFNGHREMRQDNLEGQTEPFSDPRSLRPILPPSFCLLAPSTRAALPVTLTCAWSSPGPLCYTPRPRAPGLPHCCLPRHLTSSQDCSPSPQTQGTACFASDGKTGGNCCPPHAGSWVPRWCCYLQGQKRSMTELSTWRTEQELG